MGRQLLSFVIILFAVIFVTGCNTSVEESKEAVSANEESSEEEESDKSEAEEETNDPEEAETQDKETLNKEEMTEEDEGEVDEDNQKQNIGDYEINLGGEMTETDDLIIIEGNSNLLPGSRVVGEVLVGDEEEPDYFSDYTEFVNDDGSFYLEIAHHDLQEETEVAVKFHFDGQQDDDIKRHYGERGQNLVGPYIYKHQGEVGGGGPDNIYKQAKVTATFMPEDEKAVRQFKEPDWYEHPEDLGDPHVWIEVEEINNDEAYFYIHGRSNLAEGSKLWLEYNHWKEAETSVLPDGSFDFKFPYEYKEETPFIIEFWPSHWSQWNEIEEAYGSEGQNFVGELVKKDKHSDKQYIEKVVEQDSKEINVPDNVELNIEGTEVTMLVPDNVLFDFDKYDLKKDSKQVLKEISETLQSLEKEDLEIEINGYTDNVGKEDYNLELSEKRAEEVKEYMEKALEDESVIFHTEGYGAKNPIASNDGEKGQEKNRRVEIVINLKQ